MQEFSYSITINADINECFRCLIDFPKLFALNPQWDVKSISKADKYSKDDEFILKIKYDRTEEEQDFRVTIKEIDSPNHITITLHSDKSRNISFTLSQYDNKTNIEYKETRDYDFNFEEKRELIYWIRSIGNYYLICKSKSPFGRLWRWFVDRCWLKMSPAGRRMVFLIVVFEALSILLLIIFLIFKFLF